MDTQYKFAEHTPMDPITERGRHVNKFGVDNTRQYVGPKGWIISRNVFTKKWQMNHTNDQDLYLTMQDTDVLPMGRHKWMIQKNACNQGETNA